MAEKKKPTKKSGKKTTNKKTTNKKVTNKKTTKRNTRKKIKSKVDRSNINLWVSNENSENISKIEMVKMPIEYRWSYVSTFGVEKITTLDEFNRWMEFMKNPESQNGRFYPKRIMEKEVELINS